jgi:hypothetical protein
MAEDAQMRDYFIFTNVRPGSVHVPDKYSVVETRKTINIMPAELGRMKKRGDEKNVATSGGGIPIVIHEIDLSA